MVSAVDFLPSYISAFMKRLITTSPNLASGRISRLVARRRRLMADVPSAGARSSGASLRPLGAVQRAALPALGDALGVEHTAQYMVPHARQVLDAPAADQHHRVLLQVVSFARDVADHFVAVGQPH